MDRETQRITIEVLSPIHVDAGGERLRRDVDFVDDRGRVYVINVDRMIEVKVREIIEAGGQVRTAEISRLLDPEEYQDYALYTLAAPEGVGREILPQIKDIMAQPYLPGSSIKGAIRTALAWGLFKALNVRFDTRLMSPSPRYADGIIEEQIFGPDPNRDLMRALQVADTEAVVPTALGLSVVALYVLDQPSGPSRLIPSPRRRFKLYLETLQPGTGLSGSLKVDEYLFSQAARGLGFNRKAEWLRNLPQRCNAFAAHLLEHEERFYQEHGPADMVRFYVGVRQVFDALDPGREFMLQMSWGTGWRAKTLGSRLEAHPFYGNIRDKYRLGRGEWSFPKSRRLVEERGRPVAALGWVKVSYVQDD